MAETIVFISYVLTGDLWSLQLYRLQVDLIKGKLLGFPWLHRIAHGID